jgi:hypothetical protein
VGFSVSYDPTDGPIGRLLQVHPGQGRFAVSGAGDADNGDWVVQGSFSGTLQWTDPPLETSENQDDAFVARLSPAGEVRWLRVLRNPEGFLGPRRLQVAAIDGVESVVMTADLSNAEGGAWFGDGVDDGEHLDATDAGIVARLDAETGATIWLDLMRTAGNSPSIGGLAAAGDSVAVAGGYSRPLTLAQGQPLGVGLEGEQTLAAAGDLDLICALYRGSDGALRWVRRVSGTDVQEASSVAIVPHGSVVAAGRFTGLAAVDAAGGLDAQPIDAREGEQALIVRWLR